MSKALMMSEIKVVPYTGTGWGGPQSDFSTPNSPVPDEIADLVLSADVPESNKIPRPIPASHSYSQVITSGGHRAGGVNAAPCDGAVQFAVDEVDLKIWRGLASARGEVADCDPATHLQN